MLKLKLLHFTLVRPYLKYVNLQRSNIITQNRYVLKVQNNFSRIVLECKKIVVNTNIFIFCFIFKIFVFLKCITHPSILNSKKYFSTHYCIDEHVYLGFWRPSTRQSEMLNVHSNYVSRLLMTVLLSFISLPSRFIKFITPLPSDRLLYYVIFYTTINCIQIMVNNKNKKLFLN